MFDLKLQDKTAVVTGGASGIGLAIAKGLSRLGATVIIADIAEHGNQCASELSAEGRQVSFFRTDVRFKSEVVHLGDYVKQMHGGAEILINVAGIYPFYNMLDTSEETWDLVMDINLKGMFLCCQTFVPQMIAKGQGVILNISSSLAENGMSNLFAYSISKGGVNTLTRNLAAGLAQHKIRVNAVNPGWVLTEKEIAERAAIGQSSDWHVEQGKLVPLGRMQTGEDTASLICYLASEQASQITGQVIHIDGGTSVINWHERKG